MLYSDDPFPSTACPEVLYSSYATLTTSLFLLPVYRYSVINVW